MSLSGKRTSLEVSKGQNRQPPKKVSRDTRTAKFTIFDFANCDEQTDVYIESPKFRMHGHWWQIHVGPRGASSSASKQTYVTCLLSLCEPANIITKFSFQCKQFIVSLNPPRNIRLHEEAFGSFDLVDREIAIEQCLEEDGSLIIECEINYVAVHKPVWYPKKLVPQSTLMALYRDGLESSDVCFSVEGTIYRAHKDVLLQRCSHLYDIAEDTDDTTIPILSVKASIFQCLLEFIYAVKIPTIETKDIARELLIAADQYECVQLKLYVESVIVEKFLVQENAAELMILANSYSCALLQETAFELFTIDQDGVMDNAAWDQVKESNHLLQELLYFAGCPEEDRGSDVSELRQQLIAMNMEVDGSRQVLQNRIKKSYGSSNEGGSNTQRVRTPPPLPQVDDNDEDDDDIDIDSSDDEDDENDAGDNESFNPDDDDDSYDSYEDCDYSPIEIESSDDDMDYDTSNEE